MLKEHESFLKKLFVVGDLFLVALAFFAGHYLRNNVTFILQFEGISRTYSISTYLNILPYVLLAWFISLFFAKAYQPLRARGIYWAIWDITKAALIATVIFGSVAYLSKLTYVSRTLITMVSVLAWLFISIERIVVIAILAHLRKKGYDTRYVLLVGTGKRAQTYIEMTHNHPEWGLKVFGILDQDPTLLGKEVMKHTVLGTLDDMQEILEKNVIDEVVFVVPRRWLGEIEDSILIAELLGKRVSIAVDLFNMRFATAVQRNLNKFPLLTFETTSNRIAQAFVKRVLDILLSIAGIIIVSPVMLVTALLIKVSSPGPIIFKQTRCSLNGREFTLFKFRTMVVDAESKLAELQKHNEMTGPAFKMTNDPRIIRFGKVMRKFSIDELPQLFNVLQGDMSFVGPRPPIPAEVKKYAPWQRRRLSMRPGLTCIWQVQGRNRIVKFDEWMKLDLQYIDEWTLWLDLRLFLKTIPIVIFGIGAK